MLAPATVQLFTPARQITALVAALATVLCVADSTSEVFSASKFAERVEASGLTGREIATRLGVTPAQVSALRNGRRNPSMDGLKRIVEALGGSAVDYLVLPDKERWTLRHFRVAAGLTQLEVSQDLGVAPAAVSGWEVRRYKPPRALLPRLAELYGAGEADLDAAVGYEKLASPAEGLVALAQSVIGVVEVALAAAAAVDDRERQTLLSAVNQHLERSLDSLSSAVRGLPEGQLRLAAVDAVRQMAELYAAANKACR